MAINNRLRLLQGAAALLYLGPLLAGLGDYGWRVVPVFSAIFVLWLIILRPSQWPRDLQAWRETQVWAASLGAAMVQVLLVTVCFGIGRGLGGVMGFVPMLHPMLPVAVSFLSIPLSRLIWNPGQAAGMDQFLGDAIAQIRNPDHQVADPTDTAVAVLLALPGDANLQQVRPELDAVLDHPQAWQRLDALVVALDRLEPDRRALRTTLIEWATEPAVVAAGRPHSTVDSAFQLAGSDPDLLRLFLIRAQMLIAAFPDRHDSFPSPRDLQYAICDGQPTDISDGMRSLSISIEAATPPELRDPPGEEFPIDMRVGRMIRYG